MSKDNKDFQKLQLERLQNLENRFSEPPINFTPQQNKSGQQPEKKNLYQQQHTMVNQMVQNIPRTITATNQQQLQNTPSTQIKVLLSESDNENPENLKKKQDKQEKENQFQQSNNNNNNASNNATNFQNQQRNDRSVSNNNNNTTTENASTNLNNNNNNNNNTISNTSQINTSSNNYSRVNYQKKKKGPLMSGTEVVAQKQAAVVTGGRSKDRGSRRGSSDSNSSVNNKSLMCRESLNNENKEDHMYKKKLTDFFTNQQIKRSNSKPNQSFQKHLQKQQLQNSSASNANNSTGNQKQFISINAINNNSNSNNIISTSNNNLQETSKKAHVFDNKVVVSDIEATKQIQTLEQLVSQKERIISNKDNQLKSQQEQIDSMKQQWYYQEQIYVNYKQKVMQVTAQTKLQIEKQCRQERKNEILVQKTRLGEITQQREGTKFIDVWKDGIEFVKVKEKHAKLQMEREELEKQKKLLKPDNTKKKQNNKQTSLTSFLEQNDSNNADLFELSYEEKKQNLDYQIMIVKREEGQNYEKFQQLEHEKLMLVQKMKLDLEESNCRFGKTDLPNDQQWPILAERYQVLSLLGKGGFSEVYKAYDLDEMKQVACKIHQMNPNWSENSKINYIKHAIRETNIHRELIHPNIVRLFDSVELDSNSFCTMLEYCDGQDLSHYMKQQKALTEKEAKVLIKQILNGLKYMHNHKTKVIHYDLKPQNILFHKGQLKISDFGLSKIIEDESTRLELTSQGVGTYWYLPPETFESPDTYGPSSTVKNDQNGEPVKIGTKVDVWSLGVIFFEMIYGQRPFGHGMSQDKILKERIILKATEVNFPIKSPAQQVPVSKECQDFIKKCLTYNMEERWDINEAHSSVYMSKK